MKVKNEAIVNSVIDPTL